MNAVLTYNSSPRAKLQKLMAALLTRLFPPEPVNCLLDASSRQYFDRLERTKLPYRQFNETVGRVVPGSKKEGEAAPPPPPKGTRASREHFAALEA